MRSNSPYAAPEYEPNEAVSGFKSVPRFGHSAEFADLIDADERTDYVLGLLFIPVMLSVTTILWFTCALCFKCCYPKNLGCLAGKSLKSPAYGESNLLNNFVRSGFVFFAIFSVGASIYVMTAEHSALNVGVVGHFHAELSGILTMAKTAAGLLSDLARHLVLLKDTTATLVTDIGNMGCSDVPGFKDIAQIGDELKKADFGSFDAQVHNFQSDLNDTFVGLESNGETVIDDVEKYSSIGLNLVGGYLLIMELILLAGALLAWTNNTHKWFIRCQQYLFMPLSCFATIFCLIFTAASGVVLIVVSDACTGGSSETPEGTISTILNSSGTDNVMIDYYIINGCRSPNNYSFLYELYEFVPTLIDNVTAALDDVGPTFDQCAGWNDVHDSLNTSLILSEDIVGLLKNTTQLVECSNLNPIFVGLIHDGFCDRVPKFFSSTFNLGIVLWVCGLLMFLFRSALKPDKEQDSSVDEGERVYLVQSDDGEFIKDPIREGSEPLL